MSVPTLKRIALIFFIGIITILPAVSFAAEDLISTCTIDVFCYMTHFFNWASLAIGMIIGYIAGFFLSIAASLIQILIQLSSDILSNTIVKTGFEITLSLANLGFVLAIIIIAFATILRIQSYAMKQLLWKLVAAALLVNFSFAIAGVFIDFTNLLGLYFLKAAAPGDLSVFASNLAASLNISKLQSIKPLQVGGVTEIINKFGGSYLQMFASILSVAVFSTVLVIVFFGLAFMLLIRLIYLIILLILMPIAWLFWIFPDLSGHWRSWWSKFIQWNFFLPAASFFLYLSIVTSQKIGEIVNTGGQQLAAEALGGANKFVLWGQNQIIVLIQIIVQVGILVGGLIAAQSMGIAGASALLGAAKGASRWITGTVGKIALKPAAWTGGAIANRMLQKGGLVDRFATKLQGVPLLGRAVPGLKNLVASRAAAVEALDAKYKNYSKEAIYAEAQLFTVDQPKQAHLANRMAKDGTLEKFEKENPGAFEHLMSASKAMGTTKDIIANTPEYAYKLVSREDVKKKAVENALIKPEETLTDDQFREFATKFAVDELRPSKIDDFSPERIEKLARFFGSTLNERLGKEGSTAQITAAIKIGYKELVAGNKEHPLVRFSIANPAAQRIVKENKEAFRELYDSIEKMEKTVKEKTATQRREEIQRKGGIRRGGEK